MLENELIEAIERGKKTLKINQERRLNTLNQESESKNLLSFLF